MKSLILAPRPSRRGNPFRTPADAPISRPQPGPAVLQLTRTQQRELVRMYGTGEHTIADLAEVFTISRTTVYRTL